MNLQTMVDTLQEVRVRGVPGGRALQVSCGALVGKAVAPVRTDVLVRAGDTGSP